VLCLCYVAVVGFYMSALDVLLLFVDIILLVLFGTALSSVVNFFLSTQGQISAVGTMVSSCYGFIPARICQFPRLQRDCRG
jgi:multidrug/hemolysin transport system permease protein